MEELTADTGIKNFDLIVIGGGITGATIAYEAASRGLSVALLEKSDFGGATSSATSKMIHGGLRYLSKFELSLVYESLRERKVLMNIAPNFVSPKPFVYAVYKGDKTPGWMVRIGLTLYDLLSFDRNKIWDKSKKVPGHKKVSVKEISAKEKYVNTEGLVGGLKYYDGFSISPERLTLAFIKSAIKYGAKVANYTEVRDFHYSEKDGKKKVVGVQVYDFEASREYTLHGKAIVNCTGPWADIMVAKAFGREAKYHLKRSEGIHMVTDKLVSEYVFTSATKSGRHFFVVPWRNKSFIGTTDQEYFGAPDDYKITQQSLDSFIDEVNQVFGNGSTLMRPDIRFVYGGLRPLVESNTGDVYKASRKYEIVDHGQDGLEGFYTIEGGKYTTSRSLAQKVVKLVGKKLGVGMPPSISAKQHLAGCEIENMEAFTAQKIKEYKGFDEQQITYLTQMYGAELDTLMEVARENEKYRLKLNADGEILGQVVYAIRSEIATKLPDILFRRTGLGTLVHPGKEILNMVANVAAKELNWDDARKQKELEEVEKKFKIPGR